ncbi:50S ribosomal protein L24 [bacterium]|nr:50S ribosomal protein L24 [bacterium]MBU1072649.1 50S ribosomal protein L24 [bacterium]MBU1675639.1 50S ribosomal protein L24 [bacterium]
MHIKKKDKVRVISGNHKGMEGEVLKVYPDAGRVIVEKVNLIKRHTRQSKQAPQGGIIEKEASIEASNLMLICPKCGKAARTGTEVLGDGMRVRTCKLCGEMLAN